MSTNEIGHEKLSISSEESLQVDVTMQSNTNSEDYMIQVSLEYLLNNLFIVGIFNNYSNNHK